MTLDVLLVSLGSTVGLRAADAELAGSIERAGASVSLVSAIAPRELRTMMLTDFGWALGARAAARLELRSSAPRAVIYSSTTAALLWPRPGAIRFDAPAAANRRGRHGLWQRPLERRRLGQAPLLIPQSEGALRELPAGIGTNDRALVVPVPVEPSSSATSAGAVRDIAAITYAANPSKKGLDRVLEAWNRVRSPGEELVVAGATSEELDELGYRVDAEGVRVVGKLQAREYRRLLSRCELFVTAPRREDHGIAQLEALIDGCRLVTTAAPGAYEALSIALELDPRLVGEDLGRGMRTALDDPVPSYGERALELLRSFRRAAVDEIVAGQLLPRLLA